MTSDLNGRQVSATGSETPDGLELAHRLIAAGIPVVVVKPGDVPPEGWQNATADLSHLKGYRPGTDALALVGGHGLDLVDVDTKDGGDVSNLPPFTRWGLTGTPSGGSHHVVPSSGLGKISPLRTTTGLVGDYVGGRPDGTGRLLGFLPGSHRSRYPDGGYTVLETWDVQGVLAAEPEQDLVDALLASGGRLDSTTRYKDESPERPAEAGVHPYAVGGVNGELARLDACQEDGWDGEFWDQTSFNVACNLIELANSRWSGYSLEQAEREFLKHAPTDPGFGPAQHLAKWSSALNRVEDGGRRPPGDRDAELAGGGTETAGSSWTPVDLTSYLDGTHQAPTATLMPRADGICLLYPGMTHSLHGESESGKSMIVQGEIARLLAQGQRCALLDYESDPGSVIERLRLMGATDEHLGRLVYVQPQADQGSSQADRDAFDALLAHRFALVVIDGVTQALSHGTARESRAGLGGNDDYTAWHDRLPRRLAIETGAAVVQIDHVAKGPDGGRFAIGAQAKMATITGAAYLVRPKSALGRGLVGAVHLLVAKDRPGYVRSNAVGALGADRLQYVATAVVDGQDGALSVRLMPPPLEQAADDRRTELMGKVAAFLETLPEDHPGASKTLVRTGAGAKAALVDEALDVLVAEGYVSREVRGQGHLHRLVRPFVPEPDA